MKTAAALVFVTVTGSVLAVACGGAPAGGGEAGAAGGSAAIAGPKYPPPFTAEQIRSATRPGRTYRYRVERADMPPSERVMTFASVDAEGAELTTEGEPKKRVSWDELRRHAEFPAAIVKTREETVTVPAGTFECVVYVVLGEGGEATSYFFAKNLPGAPVRILTNKDGRRVMTSTLVEHRPGK